MTEIRKIVVGVDGSQGSRAALEWAIQEGRLRNEPVEIVHCWKLNPSYGGKVALLPDELALFEQSALRLVAEMITDVSLEEGDNVRKVVRFGSATNILIDESRKATMLVVGARGRGGFSGLLLGSVSTKVAAHAACPVVVVPVQ